MINLFHQYPDGPQGWQEINRWISLYGNSDKTIDFIYDSTRTLDLLWELVTAKLGKVTFEYTVGACIISGKDHRVTAATIGRAVAMLFLEVMKREAQEAKK